MVHRKMLGAPKGKPRGKPFAKGNTANPAGRPRNTPERAAQRRIEQDARILSKQFGTEAVEKLVHIMRGTVPQQLADGRPKIDDDGRPVMLTANVNAQLIAANAILDRGYGRPPQALEVFGGDVTPESKEESALEIIRRKLTDIEARERGTGPAPAKLN